jgi:hypothetical protein
MTVTQLDAIKRIAEVNNVIAQQRALKSELEMKGVPVERIGYVIDILLGCRCVIEASIATDNERAAA